MKPTLSISIGDLNGVGIDIALRAHEEISKFCRPLYCINDTMLRQAAALLKTDIPEDFDTVEMAGQFTINPGTISADSGKFAYDSFMKGVTLCENGITDALVTLPIHKEAWAMAGLTYKGHTDLLRKYFNKEAIMMLGCDKLYVALFTEHTPLKDVPSMVTEDALTDFLITLQKETGADKIAVLGLNPHAGDNGVLGDEEKIIEKAIANANTSSSIQHPTKGESRSERDSSGGSNIFFGPVVPDIAFTPNFRKDFRYMVAMYHDQGLGPLKALYFDESINVSLNLPIIRTSVDHGTAFDIAYKEKPNTLSYVNAVTAALGLI